MTPLPSCRLLNDAMERFEGNMGYLSIKQFAERVEQSEQAIYKAAQGRLKNFVKIENGRKVIDSVALSLYGKDAGMGTDIPSAWLDEIEFLRKQLQEKDEQIHTLHEEICRLTDANAALVQASLYQSQKFFQGNIQ